MNTPLVPESDILQLAKNIELAQPESVKLRRSHARLDAEGLCGTCGIADLSGVSNEHPVFVVDVSVGGMQIIWPCFVHNGTQMRINLKLAGRDLLTICGKSVWCHFLRGRFHAVGIQADSPISVCDLVSHQTWLEACASHPELQNPITGKLVVFGQNELTVDSALFQIRDQRIETTKATTRGELIDLVEQSKVDIIVIDADSEEDDAAEVLDACRGRSFNGPVVLISMDTDVQYLAKMDTLGRSRHVQMPASNGAITAAIRDIVREHPECMVDSAPIYSQSPPSLQRKEALDRFIALTTEMCDEAQKALENERIELVNKIVTSIAACGGSHGYPELSTAAIRYLTAAYDPAKHRSLHSLLRSITSIAGRLESGDCKCARA